MRAKSQVLNVDYIGGQGALTKSEEESLSAYFKQKKIRTRKTSTAVTKTRKKQAV